jgi:hypothetical protein
MLQRRSGDRAPPSTRSSIRCSPRCFPTTSTGRTSLRWARRFAQGVGSGIMWTGTLSWAVEASGTLWVPAMTQVSEYADRTGIAQGPGFALQALWAPGGL